MLRMKDAAGVWASGWARTSHLVGSRGVLAVAAGRGPFRPGPGTEF